MEKRRRSSVRQETRLVRQLSSEFRCSYYLVALLISLNNFSFSTSSFSSSQLPHCPHCRSWLLTTLFMEIGTHSNLLSGPPHSQMLIRVCPYNIKIKTYSAFLRKDALTFFLLSSVCSFIVLHFPFQMSPGFVLFIFFQRHSYSTYQKNSVIRSPLWHDPTHRPHKQYSPLNHSLSLTLAPSHGLSTGTEVPPILNLNFKFYTRIFPAR